MLLLLAVVGLAAFALYRNVGRRLHSCRFRRFQGKVQPIVRDLFAGSIKYEDGLNQLRALSGCFRRCSLEELLMADRNPPADRIRVLRRLCEDLGWVAAWQRRLVIAAWPITGDSRVHYRSRAGMRAHPLGFVRRAEAAENLGIVQHNPSWPVLVKALSDPHVTVRSVAARALARIGEPESFSPLAEYLPSAALQVSPKISTGTLKMALASFRLSEAARLRKFLEHSCGEVRSLAARVISAMAEQETALRECGDREPLRLDPEIADTLFARLVFDKNPEVRARVAEVAGYVGDFRSLPLLQLLVDDPEWFVRLHAIRALARHRPASLNAISRRLTDSNWHVREAAAQALYAYGQTGVGRLLEHFSSTEDRYSQEQIAEQMSKAGVLPALLETFDARGRESERGFVEGMVRTGKGEMLLAAITSNAARKSSEALLSAFSLDPDLTIRPPAEPLAEQAEDATEAGQVAMTGSSQPLS
jgi:HEAT repeat protein